VRNGAQNHLADAGGGEREKDDSGEKDRAEGGLPGDVHLEADGVGEVGVEAHAGRERDGIAGDDAHEDGAEGGERQVAAVTAARGMPVCREDGRVDQDDVGHGQEGGDAGQDLGAPVGPQAREFKIALAGGADDVEVGHGGLHEDHVGAFVEIEVDFAHGFAEVGAIHLIGAAVAELGRGVGGFAEGAVESRGKFRGVAEDGRVGTAGFIEGLADGGDAAVHHVAGGDDVGSGEGETRPGAGEQVEGGVVFDRPSFTGFRDDAAVAVAGVFAQADVGDEDEFLRGRGLLDGAQSLLHDAVFIPCAGALLVLGFGQAEEEQAAEAQSCRFFCFADGFIDGEVEDAGHGADGLAHGLAGADEQGVDQVAGLQSGFAHQGAQGLGAAQAAHARFRETHELNCRAWAVMRWCDLEHLMRDAAGRWSMPGTPFDPHPTGRAI
jgi:hypothetical protein